MLASDLRGRLALAGPKSQIRSAYNWFSSAADRQHPAPMMFPPLILTPMALRIGDYFTAVGRYEDAIEAYQRALRMFPNDMNALTGLKRAYEKAKLTAEVRHRRPTPPQRQIPRPAAPDTRSRFFPCTLMAPSNGASS